MDFGIMQAVGAFCGGGSGSGSGDEDSSDETGSDETGSDGTAAMETGVMDTVEAVQVRESKVRAIAVESWERSSTVEMCVGGKTRLLETKSRQQTTSGTSPLRS